VGTATRNDATEEGSGNRENGTLRSSKSALVHSPPFLSDVEAVQPLRDTAGFLCALALDHEVDDDLQVAVSNRLH
jgi:hypothetical protein